MVSKWTAEQVKNWIQSLSDIKMSSDALSKWSYRGEELLYNSIRSQILKFFDRSEHENLNNLFLKINELYKKELKYLFERTLRSFNFVKFIRY